MMAARKFSAEFWKNCSEPPFLSPPFCSDSSSVAAVSDACHRLSMYFAWMGLTRLEYSTSVKLMIRNPQLRGVLP